MISPLSENNISLELKRVIAASRERVFEAWTDPSQMQKWYKPGAGVVVQSVKVDLRVGGKYRVQTQHPNGEYFTSAGTYREVTRPERLVFTWAWEKDGSEPDFGELEPHESLVTVEFLEQGKQTVLVLRHERFASVQSRDGHIEGWNGCLDIFQKEMKGVTRPR